MFKATHALLEASGPLVGLIALDRSNPGQKHPITYAGSLLNNGPVYRALADYADLNIRAIADMPFPFEVSVNVLDQWILNLPLNYRDLGRSHMNDQLTLRIEISPTGFRSFHYDYGNLPFGGYGYGYGVTGAPAAPKSEPLRATHAVRNNQGVVQALLHLDPSKLPDVRIGDNDRTIPELAQWPAILLRRDKREEVAAMIEPLLVYGALTLSELRGTQHMWYVGSANRWELVKRSGDAYYKAMEGVADIDPELVSVALTTAKRQIEGLKYDLEQAELWMAKPAMPEWSRTAPPEDVMFHAYHPSLEDADFNPLGVVEACWDGEKFVGAVWNGQQDCWDTRAIGLIEYWKSITGPHSGKKEIKDNGEPTMLAADGSRSVFCDVDEGGDVGSIAPQDLASNAQWLKDALNAGRVAFRNKSACLLKANDSMLTVEQLLHVVGWHAEQRLYALKKERNWVDELTSENIHLGEQLEAARNKLEEGRKWADELTAENIHMGKRLVEAIDARADLRKELTTAVNLVSALRVAAVENSRMVDNAWRIIAGRPYSDNQVPTMTDLINLIEQLPAVRAPDQPVKSNHRIVLGAAHAAALVRYEIAEMQQGGLIDNGPSTTLRAVAAFLDTVALASINVKWVHADDLSVAEFAQAMKELMADKRAKGYSGWDELDTEEARVTHSASLRASVEKGDPLDVANYAMMLWAHGRQRIAPSADQATKGAQAVPDDLEVVEEAIAHYEDQTIGQTEALKGLKRLRDRLEAANDLPQHLPANHVHTGLVSSGPTTDDGGQPLAIVDPDLHGAHLTTGRAVDPNQTLLHNALDQQATIFPKRFAPDPESSIEPATPAALTALEFKDGRITARRYAEQAMVAQDYIRKYVEHLTSRSWTFVQDVAQAPEGRSLDEAMDDLVEATKAAGFDIDMSKVEVHARNLDGSSPWGLSSMTVEGAGRAAVSGTGSSHPRLYMDESAVFRMCQFEQMILSDLVSNGVHSVDAGEFDHMLAEAQSRGITRAEAKRRSYFDHYGTEAVDMKALRKAIDPNHPEAYRRERKGFDTTPIPGVVDYGISGTSIDNAIHHLNESLPVGQKRRTELAFKQLAVAVAQLHDWLAAKGLEVGK